jgi:ABC-type branched-subunit amino acid transport system ATPase component
VSRTSFNTRLNAEGTTILLVEQNARQAPENALLVQIGDTQLRYQTP